MAIFFRKFTFLLLITIVLGVALYAAVTKFSANPNNQPTITEEAAQIQASSSMRQRTN